MLKKLIILFFCLILALSFAACKKDKGDIESSSQQTTSDTTQDYENDKWGNGDELTEEEKEEIEDVWNDLVQNGGGATITPGNNSSSTSNSSSSNSSSQNSSSTASSSEPVESSKPTQSEATSSDSSSEIETDEGLAAEIVVSRPAIW